MTRYNTSRGMMYTDLPTEEEDEENQTDSAATTFEGKRTQVGADD